MTKKTIYGNKLRLRRLHQGLSQRQFALLIGAHAPSVCAWEGGSRNVPERYYEVIQAVLRVPIDMLYKNITPRKPLANTHGDAFIVRNVGLLSPAERAMVLELIIKHLEEA